MLPGPWGKTSFGEKLGMGRHLKSRDIRWTEWARGLSGDGHRRKILEKQSSPSAVRPHQDPKRLPICLGAGRLGSENPLFL